MKKLILITGATGGIGKNYSREMLNRGYNIVITYRNKEAGLKLQKELQEEFPNLIVDAMMIDLGSIDSIKSFATSFIEKYNRLDVLVHNAGVYFFDKNRRVSKDNIEINMAIHVVAPFILTGLLMPVLEKTPESKIIGMSSTEHKGAKLDTKELILENTSVDKVDNMKSYSSSKFAILTLMTELNRRLKNANKDIIALSAHPGVSITGIQHKGNPSKAQKLMIGLMGRILAGKPEEAAKSLVLATLEGKGGEYYGPTGFKEAKGKPGLVKPDINTLDEGLGKELWSVLEKITGFRYLD